MPTTINITVDAPPAPSQTPAIGLIGQLMDPTCVLIIEFRNDGYVSLSTSVLSGGSYTLHPLVVMPPGPDPITFEFSVDVSQNQVSGLVVERSGDWNQPWDDEVAYVLGGDRFPFGADPLPLQGSKTPGVYPLPTLGGSFQGPLAGGASSVLTIGGSIYGSSRTTTCKIDPLKVGTTLTKSLSLWLPQSADGKMKVVRGADVESHSYSSKELLTLAAASLLMAAKAPRPVKALAAVKKKAGKKAAGAKA